MTDQQGVRGYLVEAVLDASDDGLKFWRQVVRKLERKKTLERKVTPYFHDLVQVGMEELLRMSGQQAVQEVECVNLHV